MFLLMIRVDSIELFYWLGISWMGSLGIARITTGWFRLIDRDINGAWIVNGVVGSREGMKRRRGGNAQ
jgi:hypothetical protein